MAFEWTTANMQQFLLTSDRRALNLSAEMHDAIKAHWAKEADRAARMVHGELRTFGDAKFSQETYKIARERQQMWEA